MRQLTAITIVFLLFVGTNLFLTPQSVHAGTIPPPVSYWNFNESGGTVAHDSGVGNNGVLVGSATFVPGGVEGGAVQIDGTANGYVDMGDIFDFNNSSAYSLQVWLKMSPSTPSGIAVSRHLSGTVAGYFVGIGNTGDGCSGGPGSAHLYTEYPCSPASTTVVNDGNWHQIVGTLQGGVASIYVDGTFEGSSSGNVLNQLNGYHFLVGAINVSGVPSNSFTGLIDDVGVWDQALTPTQVTSLYDSYTATPEPNTLFMLIPGAIVIGILRHSRLGC